MTTGGVSVGESEPAGDEEQGGECQGKRAHQILAERVCSLTRKPLGNLIIIG